MRIGLFTDTYPPQVNGVVTVVRTLKKELEARGHEVFVFTVTHPDAQAEDRVVRMPSVKFPTEPQHRIGFFFKPDIVKTVRELNLDIIHSHTEFSLYLAARTASKKLGIPSVHTVHTFYQDYLYYLPLIEPLLKRQLPRLLNRLYKNQRCIVAPSVKIKDYLNSCGFEGTVEVIPNGIDLSPFYQDADDPLAERNAVRDRFGIPRDAELIVFVGRLAAEKNISTLLDNFRRIAAQRPKAFLCIVGDGPDRRLLESHADDIGIGSRCAFTGYLKWPMEIKSVYSAADLFMSASHSEVHPITFIEAMAAALPVVAAADPSVQGMIQNGANGWALDDDTKLWEKAVEVLADPAGRARMGGVSREVSRNYSVDRFVTGMLQLYKRYVD